jgi:hypothetical protein
MSFGNDRATCPAQDYNSRKTVSVQLGIRLKSELRCAIVIGGAARVIDLSSAYFCSALIHRDSILNSSQLFDFPA